MKKKYFAPYVQISKININPVMSATSPQTSEKHADQGGGMDAKDRGDYDEDAAGWGNGLW